MPSLIAEDHSLSDYIFHSAIKKLFITAHIELRLSYIAMYLNTSSSTEPTYSLVSLTGKKLAM